MRLSTKKALLSFNLARLFFDFFYSKISLTLISNSGLAEQISMAIEVIEKAKLWTISKQKLDTLYRVRQRVSRLVREALSFSKKLSTEY